VQSSSCRCKAYRHCIQYLIRPSLTSFFPNSRSIDIADLDGGNVADIEFPNPNDLTTFYVSVTPDSGYWKGATYQFLLDIPAQYVSNYPALLYLGF